VLPRGGEDEPEMVAGLSGRADGGRLPGAYEEPKLYSEVLDLEAENSFARPIRTNPPTSTGRERNCTATNTTAPTAVSAK
jgi:hypothetical protein